MCLSVLEYFGCVGMCWNVLECVGMLECRCVGSIVGVCWTVLECVGVLKCCGALEALKTLEALVAKVVKVGNY